MNNVSETELKPLIKLLKLDESIMEILKKVMLYTRIYTILTITSICVFVGCLVVYAIFKDETLENTILQIVAIFFVLSIILFGVGWIYGKKSRKLKKTGVYPALRKMNWTHIYNSALELIYQEKKFKITELQLNNLDTSEKGNINNTNKLLIDYGDTKLVFNIRTYVETFRHVDSKGNVTYTYKTNIDEFLDGWNNKFDFKDDVVLTQKQKARDTSFLTESIEFNKRYSINSSDNITAAKYFSPKIVDRYANLNLPSKFTKLELLNNQISVRSFFVLNFEEREYEIAHFEEYNNLKKYFTGMAKEILADIGKLYDNLVCMEPFLG